MPKYRAMIVKKWEIPEVKVRKKEDVREKALKMIREHPMEYYKATHVKVKRKRR